MKNSNEKNAGTVPGSGKIRIIALLLCLCLIGGVLIYGMQSALRRTALEETGGTSGAGTGDVSVSQNVPVTDSAGNSAGGAGAGSGSTENTDGAAAGQAEPAGIMPAEGEIVKDYAGDELVYSKTLNQYLVHKAVDIKAPAGEPVIAVDDGTVIFVKDDERYGLTVGISHGEELETRYCGLGEALVSEGDVVSGGDRIGTVGEDSLFEKEDGPHLHFETMKEAIPVNPHEIWGW